MERVMRYVVVAWTLLAMLAFAVPSYAADGKGPVVAPKAAAAAPKKPPPPRTGPGEFPWQY